MSATQTRPITLQAIQTRFLGPTNTRGARIKATCASGSLTQSWEYGTDGPTNHLTAARNLQAKLGWSDWAIESGVLPGGDYCHVQVCSLPLCPNDR